MATHKKIRWRLEERDLDELIDFPFQSAVFPDRPEEENQALDEDISKNGLKHPIEILPENTAGLPPDTILAGHRRKASLLRLGRRTSKVRVRYDLSRADRTEIEEFFIDDNDNRRDYSPLDRARIALRRFEMKQGVEPGELRSWDETDARKRIAKP